MKPAKAKQTSNLATNTLINIQKNDEIDKTCKKGSNLINTRNESSSSYLKGVIGNTNRRYHSQTQAGPSNTRTFFPNIKRLDEEDSSSKTLPAVSVFKSDQLDDPSFTSDSINEILKAPKIPIKKKSTFSFLRFASRSSSNIHSSKKKPPSDICEALNLNESSKRKIRNPSNTLAKQESRSPVITKADTGVAVCTQSTTNRLRNGDQIVESPNTQVKEVIKNSVLNTWCSTKITQSFSEKSDKNQMPIDSKEAKNRLHKWREMISNKYREIVITALLLLGLLNAIQSDRLATRQANAPVKFFTDEQGYVVDLEFGSLSTLASKASQCEVTIVMYYAPWDAACQRARREFETTARHFKSQVLFIAINCWWPEGECSRTYKIKRYPVFVSHLRNVAEVEYKGPPVASYLIPFVDNLLNPLVPLVSEGDLLDLKAGYDGVVVGYFDFNESLQPHGYSSFLEAAIQILQADPWRRIVFAVVSNSKLAEKFGFEQPKQVFIHTWNDTVLYGGRLTRVETFVNWILEIALHQSTPLVEWITSSGVKSDLLASRLFEQATLILFTPRSLILGISPYFDILRELAMDYFNCDNSPQIKSLIHRAILRRRQKEEKLVELEEKCHEILQQNLHQNEYKRLYLPPDFSRNDRCCYSQFVRWRPQGRNADKKCFCTSCVNIDTKICPSNCKKFNCLATASRYLSNFEPQYMNSSKLSYCSDIKSKYSPNFMPYYSIETSCSGINPEISEENAFKTKTPLEPIHSDESMERMMKSFEEHHCQRLSLGLNYSDFNFPDSSESNTVRGSIAGLGCKTNKTLQFIAIDSILYQSFTENLGIDILNETHATVAMIVEAKQESIYVLNEQLRTNKKQMVSMSKSNLYQFVRNYTSNKLKRYLRNQPRISTSDECKTGKDAQGHPVFCIPEVTSHSFDHLVLDQSKDVILLYYTPWCGFCSSIAHFYLTVAKFFSDNPLIRFARINADSNDLPFEYSVDRYPSIVFYPAGKKMESIAYPSNMPITTSSLLQFVLSNLQPTSKWTSTLKFCDTRCLRNSILRTDHEQRTLKAEINNLKSKRLYVLTQREQAKKNKLKKSKKQINIENAYLLQITKLILQKMDELQSGKVLRNLIFSKLNSGEETVLNSFHAQLMREIGKFIRASKITFPSKAPKEQTTKQKVTTTSKKIKLKSKPKKKDEL